MKHDHLHVLVQSCGARSIIFNSSSIIDRCTESKIAILVWGWDLISYEVLKAHNMH